MNRRWLLIILLLLGGGCGRWQIAEPVEVELAEARSHLIAEPEPIRSTGVDGSTTVDVRLAVRSDGSVADAKIIGDRSRFDTEAARSSRSLRFRPFIRGGKAVPARVRLQLPVYPPEVWGTPAPFPQGDLGRASVTLERTGCFGSCPIYSVTVHGDGRVVYRGEAYVLLEGEHRTRIPPSQARKLFERFRAERFFSARDVYRADVTDNPAYVLTMTVGGKTKTVVDYVGETVGMPRAIQKLQEDIDAVSGSARWVEGDDRTTIAMAAAGLKPGTPGAGDILVRAAAEAPETLVFALVDAGFPLMGSRPDWPVPNSISAAVIAAENGRAEVFRRLAAAGALGETAAVRNEALRAAVASGSAETVREVLRHAPDPNAVNDNGETALHVLSDTFRADESGAQIARMLLNAGANPNGLDRDGQTPLFGSLNPAVVRLLVQAGARLDTVSQHGETALSRTSSEDVAIVLVEAGAPLGVQGPERRTALDRAIAKRWWKAAAAIVFRGD